MPPATHPSGIVWQVAYAASSPWTPRPSTFAEPRRFNGFSPSSISEAVRCLIAATAEAASLTILHYDADFDLIASVTGQSCKWIVPAGSIP